MSPRAMLRRMRVQLPDTLLALQQLPQIFHTAVRDAADGRLRLQVDNPAVPELREDLRRSSRRRDAAAAAAVLWISGLVWLALTVRMPWLGWSQMTAAIGLVVWSRASRARRA